MRLDKSPKEYCCPYCHKKGSLEWHPATRLLQCNACHISNLSEDVIAIYNTSSSVVATMPTSNKADYVIDQDQVFEDEETGQTIEGVAYHVPRLPAEEIPTLYVDKALCEFFAWLYKDAVAKQKRWGRDFVRSTGQRVIGKTRHEGKLIKQYGYVKP